MTEPLPPGPRPLTIGLTAPETLYKTPYYERALAHCRRVWPNPHHVARVSYLPPPHRLTWISKCCDQLVFLAFDELDEDVREQIIHARQIMIPVSYLWRNTNSRWHLDHTFDLTNLASWRQRRRDQLWSALWRRKLIAATVR